MKGAVDELEREFPAPFDVRGRFGPQALDLTAEQGPEVAIGPADGRFRTPGYQALADRQGDAELHEGHRLLYVAATRARDHLVIGLHHSTRGQSTHARELWRVCQDSAVGWWKPAEVGDQLVLPVVEQSTGFTPLSEHDRAAWRAAHDEMLAEANARRVFAAGWATLVVDRHVAIELSL